jgi:hypothetical protein
VKRGDAVCLAILVCVSAFYLFTIRSGQPWPDDFAMYIREAKSLADHTPIHETGYIYDPYNAALGPRLYPPIWPLLLVPAYLIGGLKNLLPMQIEVILFFIAALIILWRGLGRELSPANQAILLTVVGFNPVLWDAKDLIASDIPFTFLLYLTLFFAEDLRKCPVRGRTRLWKILLVAALVYVCYGTRTIGAVLIPAFIICGAINWRRSHGQLLIAAGIVSMIPCWAQSRLFPGDGYGQYLALDLFGFVRTIAHNAVTYSWSLASFWQDPYSRAIRDFIFATSVLFALLAYFHRIRTGPRTYELAAALYVMVVLAFPYPGGTRYLIPMFPLFVCYALEGVGLLRTQLRVATPKPVLASLLVLVLLSYGSEFSHFSFGPFADGVGKRESKELFAFIKARTNPDDVLIFRRPRALALFTGRSAAVYPALDNRDKYASYLQAIAASYVIEAPALDDPAFDRFLASDCPAKHLVFKDADFEVFHLTAAGIHACSDNLHLSADAQ